MSGTVVAVKVAPLPGPNVQTNDKGLRVLEHECRVYDRLYGSTEHPHVLRVTGPGVCVSERSPGAGMGVDLVCCFRLCRKAVCIVTFAMRERYGVCVCVAFEWVTIPSQQCLQ